MKKNRSDFDNPTYFSGKCNSCGEVYETYSKTDDLEGVHFQCRKVLCDGMITLVTVHSPSPHQPELAGPRRYC